MVNYAAKIEKLVALHRRPGTPGEGAAAIFKAHYIFTEYRVRLDSLSAGASAAIRAYQNELDGKRKQEDDDMVARTGPRNNGRDRERDRDRDRGRDRDDRRDTRRGTRDERRGASSGARSGGDVRHKFVPRDPDAVKKRAERRGRQFDTPFKDNYDTYRPEPGTNEIRILPFDREHFGYQFWAHQYIGASVSTFPCLKRMKNKPCACCDAADEARRAGEKDDAKKLEAKERYVYWILDMEGDDPTKPILWSVGKMQDHDIAGLTWKRKGGGVLSVEDPIEGYNLQFDRVGNDQKTRYSSYQFDRDPSKIARKQSTIDEILDYIGANPLPSVIKYYDNDYIEGLLAGTTGERDDDDDDRYSRRRRSRDDDDDQRGERNDDDADRGSRRRGRDDAERSDDANGDGEDEAEIAEDDDTPADDDNGEEAPAEDTEEEGGDDAAEEEGGTEAEAEDDGRRSSRRAEPEEDDRRSNRREAKKKPQERVRPSEKSGKKDRAEDRQSSRRDSGGRRQFRD